MEKSDGLVAFLDVGIPVLAGAILAYTLALSRLRSRNQAISSRRCFRAVDLISSVGRRAPPIFVVPYFRHYLHHTTVQESLTNVNNFPLTADIEQPYPGEI